MKFMNVVKKFGSKKEYVDYRTTMADEAQQLINDGKIDEGNTKMEDIKELDNDYEDFAQAQANLNALNNNPSVSSFVNAMGTPAPQVVKFGPENNAVVDMFDSKEYRKSFMNYVMNGTPIMMNTDAQTTTSEVSAVIPTTVVNRIVEKMEVTGKILAKVTRTSYKGGVSVPTSTAKPTASWVAERSTADEQEKTTGSITFAYRKLICKVAISLETSIVTLDVFETTLVNNIAEAMIKAMEAAIVAGTGSTYNQPSGILAETVVTGQNVDITEGNHFTYATLAAAEAAIPEAYEADAEWCMRKKTYFNEVVGMVDSNGQPIARTNVGLDGKPAYTIFGRPVNFSDSVSAFATTVTADTVVAFLFNFKDYMLNTNLAMSIRKYTDEATDDQIMKSIMLVDGKVVDKNSLVTVTVKNS